MSVSLRKILLFALVLLFAQGASAQITINHTDLNMVPGVTKHMGASASVLPIDLSQNGANQSWDFTQVVDAMEFTDYYMVPDSVPGADGFPQATVGMFRDMNMEDYRYYLIQEVNEHSANTIGMSFCFGEMETTFGIEYDRPAYMFPLNYGDEWSFSMSFDFGGDLSQDTIFAVVDAWGTITDLAGEFQCLRIQSYHRTWELEDGAEEWEMTDYYKYAWVAQGYGEIFTLTSEDGEENPYFEGGSIERTISIDGAAGVGARTPELPRLISLHSAYPNPFNSSTSIGYSIPNATDVSLTVFDLAGRELARLAQGQVAAGSHTVSLNAANFATGTYLVALNADGTTLQTKIVVVK